MSCKNSVTTKTGTFTFFHEKSTRCQAEKKCKNRGEILAPVTNKRDAKKLMDLQLSNEGVEGCHFAWHAGFSYWIGLDVTYTKDKQEKVFSNGVKWRERKHGKIYRDSNNEYTDCAIAVFYPPMRKKPFAIGAESDSCDMRSLKYYACLKPANASATAESVVQEDFVDEHLTPGAVSAVGAVAVFIFAVGAIVGARVQKKKDAKKNQPSEKFAMENIPVDMNVCNGGL